MNFWTILLPILLDAASKVLPSILKPIFPWLNFSASAFFKSSPVQMQGASIAFNAPDDLRKYLTDKLTAFAATLPFESMKYVVNAMIGLLTGSLLDQLWDALFAAKVVPQPAISFGKPAMKGTHPKFQSCSESELQKMIDADHKACCGVK